MLLTDKEAPLWARQLIAVAVLLGVLILTAIGIFIWNKNTTPAPQAPPTPTPSATTASDPNESVCGLAPGPVEPAAVAPSTDWQLKGGYAYPTSRSLGPGTTTTGVGSCFAHSTQGAVMAAGAFVVDVSTRTPASLDAIRDRLRNKTSADRRSWRKLATMPSGTPIAAQIAGFRVLDASTNSVSLELLLEIDAKYASIPYVFEWIDGDWRAATPSGRGIGRGEADPFGSGGFTVWRGVGA